MTLTDEGATIMSPKKQKERKPKPMTTRQYLTALEALGLTVAGQATAKALGMGVRHCQRIAAGNAPVPSPVEKLLKMYLKHGLEDEI